MRVASILLGAALLAAPFSMPGASQTKPASSSKKPSSSRKSTRRKSPPKQTQPTADRYREIQQALIGQGFLSGEPTGVWDDRSIQAWKKFEEQQALTVDGKLDSKALIALGLAPNRKAQEAPKANP